MTVGRSLLHSVSNPATNLLLDRSTSQSESAEGGLIRSHRPKGPIRSARAGPGRVISPTCSLVNRLNTRTDPSRLATYRRCPEGEKATARACSEIGMLSSLFCSRGSTSTTAVSAATATMSPQRVAAASPEGIGTSVGGWSLLSTFSWLPLPRRDGEQLGILGAEQVARAGWAAGSESGPGYGAPTGSPRCCRRRYRGSRPARWRHHELRRSPAAAPCRSAGRG